MFKFKVVEIVFEDKTKTTLDPKTLANVQLLFDTLAAQVSQQLLTRGGEIRTSVYIYSTSEFRAAAGSNSIPDAAHHLMVNPIRYLFDAGLNADPHAIDPSFSSNLGIPDFVISLSQGFLDSINQRFEASAGIVPPVSLGIINHEFGHALAFDSQRDAMTGAFGSSSSLPMEFDRFLSISGELVTYSGFFAKAIYGSDIPMQALGKIGASIAHLTTVQSNPSVNSQVLNDPMSDGRAFSEANKQFSDLDLAIMKDCGYLNLNTLTAYDGHHFIPGLNTKLISGTKGIDTVVEAGSLADFTFALAGDQVTQIAKDGSKLMFSSIERVVLPNAALAFDLNGNAGQAYRLYQAAFNRTPDQAGLGYWIKQMDSGAENLNHVAAGFVGSLEFAKLYGQNITDDAFLTALYSNVLHRTPDKAGFEYWHGEMGSGMTRPDILASFSESTENQAQVIGQIQKGIPYQVEVYCQ
ncbi:DUF4214 domain-containing protein [Undibacterium sp. Di27W]|uniref:DUF4214 domain-containing protein n=1 Tax=Undibacterium sp. Di27W TaxID=3413036 RepID=UPI003BF30856